MNIISDISIITGELVAVRPNLNKPHILTIHKIKKNPDYSHAYFHYDGIIYLENVISHVSKASVRIYNGSNKFPCASVMGCIINKPDIKKWSRVTYNPKKDPLNFKLTDGSTWNRANFAKLHGTKLWIH